MKLGETRQILAAEGIRLTKSLGQNFLHDIQQITRIVAAAELSPTDQVLEIGPGLGQLTELLRNRAGHVLAIEKDARLVAVLSKRLTHGSHLNLVHADALEYLRSQARDWSGYKLVSNLPYSVASPILVELAKSPKPPELLVVTLQLEVARRLTASPGTRDYGILTLLVQLAYEPKGWWTIPAQCFFPVPNVDSACVTLVRRPRPLLTQEQSSAFEKIVKRAFSQRRKMMLKLLKCDWPKPKLETAFAELGISQQSRAEQVALNEFVRLTELLHGPETHNAL